MPGEHAAAALGLPDVLFFAVFLASAARWSLRTRLTWVALSPSLLEREPEEIGPWTAMVERTEICVGVRSPNASVGRVRLARRLMAERYLDAISVRSIDPAMAPLKLLADKQVF